ncbi:GNAT family N-acetyltransferase [Clostridium sp. UBA4548]|uniref:GNAT family N-acetyltransferase n=1 Tax=Clostridium sp. UBA4548 TaxID=1946361 RepID=UPI0025C21323|nr:GNAT family N-acetyltransferase [Clostridium sp. UBA4548]
MNIKVFDEVEEVPNCWDEAVEKSPLLKRKYLKLLEKTNPCGAKYYFVTDEDENKYCFVTYKLKLNMFTYSKLKLDIPITIIGVPASVSASGYCCEKEAIFLKVLKSIKGIKVVLNSNDKFKELKRGYTLPDCIMELPWNSFQSYLEAMKPSHRYRYNKIRKHGKLLDIRELEKQERFTGELYKLYENVYNKSSFKLEKLPIEFFRENSADTTVFTLEGKTVGFVQTFKEEETFYFLFGGIDYSVNKKHSLYFNMLYHIIARAIECGAKSIKMGQTAEDAKLRLGCIIEEKYLYIHSSNRALNKIIQYLVPFLSYKYNFKKYHVFINNEKIIP